MSSASSNAQPTPSPSLPEHRSPEARKRKKLNLAPGGLHAFRHENLTQLASHVALAKWCTSAGPLDRLGAERVVLGLLSQILLPVIEGQC